MDILSLHIIQFKSKQAKARDPKGGGVNMQIKRIPLVKDVAIDPNINMPMKKTRGNRVQKLMQ